MTKMLNIGVVGAGKFGGYHARKCADHSGINFIGVFDKNNKFMDELAEKTGGQSFNSLDRLFASCDAVIIATPATSHGEISIQALKAGLHILVEKPLSTELESAQIIKELSAQKKLIVQVGHQERFVARAIGLHMIPEKPILVKAQRLNPPSTRGMDTSVTMDLMTHDIDLVNYVMGGLPQNVNGRTFKGPIGTLDQSFAHLSYAHGEAFLEASRCAQSGHRSMELSYPSGTVYIDFNGKTIRHDTPFDLNSAFGAMPEARDSLGAGTHEFVSTILENRQPFISVQDGLEAVRIAIKIDEKI